MNYAFFTKKPDNHVLKISYRFCVRQRRQAHNFTHIIFSRVIFLNVYAHYRSVGQKSSMHNLSFGAYY